MISPCSDAGPLTAGALAVRATRALAAAVVLQAVHDLRAPDILQALDALLWLAGPDGAAWLGALDMRGHALQLITAGDLGRRGRRLPYRRIARPGRRPEASHAA